MIIITCDLCKREITGDRISIEVLDGEHPHNGSTMHKKIDACSRCASNIARLRVDVEYDELRKEFP